MSDARYLRLRRFGKWMLTGALPLAIYGVAIFMIGYDAGYHRGADTMRNAIMCALERFSADLPYDYCRRVGIKPAKPDFIKPDHKPASAKGPSA